MTNDIKGMTDEELGKALAEACGFRNRSNMRGWGDTRSWEWDYIPPSRLKDAEDDYSNYWRFGARCKDLAASLDAIVRDVFKAMDERFGVGKWEADINYVSGERSEVIIYAAFGIVEARHESLPCALAEACFAALTEGEA